MPYILDIDYAYGGSIIDDVSYSDLYSLNGLDFDSENWIGSNGNISADPLFVNPASDDYSLSWLSYPDPVDKSPCIDTGNPDEQDPDGTRIDMGAIFFFFDAPPSAPTNLTVTPFRDNPELTWDANTEPDLDHYNIWAKYSNYSDPGFWHKIATTTGTTWTDNNVQTPGGKHPDIIFYRLKAEDCGGNVSNYYAGPVWILGDVIYWPAKQAVAFVQIPNRYALLRNFPNPFNPITTIKYDLPEESYVELKIFNLLGEEIRTLVVGNESAGFKSMLWNGEDNKDKSVASGVYIYSFFAKSLESDKDFHKTRKMVLIR